MGRYRKGQKMRNTDLWERAGGRETVIRSFVANGFTRATIPDPERWAAIARHLFGESDLRLQKWLRTVWVENRRGIRNDLLKEKGVQQLIEYQQEQKGITTLKQEDPLLLHVKQEEEEVRITQEGECLLGKEEVGLTMLPLTGVSVKTEDHEDKSPESSQLHHNPSEENRGAEPRSSISPQHITTGADGDHCGGAETDNLIAPLSDSDDITSHSEDEDRDYAQEPLSSDTDDEGDMRTHTDNKHSKKKTGKHLTCSVCSKSFFYKCNLTQHMRTHTGEKPFSCSVCGKRFTLKSNMAPHMRLHTGERPFSCSVCGQGFCHKSNMASHMKTHTGERPFSCSMCVKTFNDERSLLKHVRTHTGEKPFSCSVCDKAFSQVSSLNIHMKRHTEENLYSCSVCGKTLNDKQSLVKHVRTHTGEKPFGCSHCNKTFCQKVTMLRHMRIHTGEKPFSCPDCHKSFSQKVNMVVHMRTHTREKPFSCPDCDNRFTMKSHLLSHLRTHTL